MNNFQKGDVVYLKSGSKPMTITHVESSGHCRVAWHDDKGNEQLSSYPSEALTKENPNKATGKQF